MQMDGCTIDPDIPFRAALSVVSDASIFFLENLIRGL
jgi:hypothetical protein